MGENGPQLQHRQKRFSCPSTRDSGSSLRINPCPRNASRTAGRGSTRLRKTEPPPRKALQQRRPTKDPALRRRLARLHQNPANHRLSPPRRFLNSATALRPIVNRYLLSDLAVCARKMAMATVRCAAYNVRINLNDFKRSRGSQKKARIVDECPTSPSPIAVIQRTIPAIWARPENELCCAAMERPPVITNSTSLLCRKEQPAKKPSPQSRPFLMGSFRPAVGRISSHLSLSGTKRRYEGHCPKCARPGEISRRRGWYRCPGFGSRMNPTTEEPQP